MVPNWRLERACLSECDSERHMEKTGFKVTPGSSDNQPREQSKYNVMYGMFFFFFFFFLQSQSYPTSAVLVYQSDSETTYRENWLYSNNRTK